MRKARGQAEPRLLGPLGREAAWPWLAIDLLRWSARAVRWVRQEGLLRTRQLHLLVAVVIGRLPVGRVPLRARVLRHAGPQDRASCDRAPNQAGDGCAFVAGVQDLATVPVSRTTQLLELDSFKTVRSCSAQQTLSMQSPAAPKAAWF